MFIIRSIKSSEEKRSITSQKERERLKSHTQHSLFDKLYQKQQESRNTPYNPGYSLNNQLQSSFKGKQEAPANMYSRSFMYVKVQSPNMRLDISGPKVAFAGTPKSDLSDQLTQYLAGSQSKGDLDLELSQTRLENTPAKGVGFPNLPTQEYLELKQAFDLTQSMIETTTVKQSETKIQSLKNMLPNLKRSPNRLRAEKVRQSKQSNLSEKPPKYKALKIKNEELDLPKNTLKQSVMSVNTGKGTIIVQS